MPKAWSQTILPLALLGALMMIAQQWLTIRHLREELSSREKEYRQAKTLLAETEERLRNSSAQYSEFEQLRKDHLELLRLRGEVPRLRNESKRPGDLSNQQPAVQQQQTEIPKTYDDRTAAYLARNSWADVGMATPEATMQTIAWAIGQTNLARAMDCFAPDFRDQFEKGIAKDPGATNPAGGFWPTVTGVEILGQRAIDADQIELVYQFEEALTKRRPEVQLLKRFGNEWKFAGEPRDLEH